MLPPVLEIYVVHHPDDPAGVGIARHVFDHFHGTAFSGLVGGAIEVYVRSAGWRNHDDAPRPIGFPDAPLANGVAHPRLTAIVPVMSLPLARAVQRRNPWRGYIEGIIRTEGDYLDRVGVFPLAVDDAAAGDTMLAELLQAYQRIAVPSGLGDHEPRAELICRDLAQGITQLVLGPAARLQIFISHTRRTRSGEENDIPELIRLVREIISETRLRHFFDANDLQPGRDWDDELRRQAANSALLALRTDLYATRAWCQKEMLIAKRAGMPVVILDALGQGEERGSFIMDHIPRVPVREVDAGWNKSHIRRGLNLLVDESLKRALWSVQQNLAAGVDGPDVVWWAPHAPEPITLTQWLQDSSDSGTPVLSKREFRILHPDPPLGPDEKEAIEQILRLMGYRGSVDIVTPRGLLARGA